MRVKLLLALAIASVLLLCSTGVALAQVCTPCSITGVPTAALLTAAADSEIAAFGFPDIDAAVAQIGDNAALDYDCAPCGLETPICGVSGDCPDCSCTGTTTIFGGPDINLGCPVVNLVSKPVLLKSPVISPVFPSINLAPQATVVVPQVTTQLNCFDISCCPLQTPVDPAW